MVEIELDRTNLGRVIVSLMSARAVHATVHQSYQHKLIQLACIQIDDRAMSKLPNLRRASFCDNALTDLQVRPAVP